MWNKVLKSTICILAVVLIVLCAVLAWFITRKGEEDPASTDETTAPTEQTDFTTVPSTEATTIPTETTKIQELAVAWEDLGDNRFEISWNDTDADGYVVELSQDGGNTWSTLDALGNNQFAFTTQTMPAFGSFQIRVSTLHGETGDVVTLVTEEKLLYSAIWPIQTLTVYDSSTKENAIGSVEAGSTYCVLGEENGMFQVRYGQSVGYIDSNYCLINVADYLGGLCAYDIPNSYNSLYRVHGVDIPAVTETVITGYEDVLLADGSFLVPVLYPTAQKLLEAAKSAREFGYRLKLYDTFRPYAATKDIYAKTESILQDVVPQWNVTVQELMTDNGRYRLGNFLAPVTSRHNYGVALDLTLETLAGEVVDMQTAMHDLSWYSALENNGENAKLLQSIMVAAGFYTLESEWWHFQDGDLFAALNPGYLTDGVNVAGWMKDDIGWRYRLADGTFLAGCQETIHGVAYEFDANGYAT